MAERTQEEKEEMYRIANTILRQMGGLAKLKRMVGANSFVVLERGVQFKFKMFHKANTILIKVNGMDTYDMEFWKITPKKGANKFHQSNDNYDEMLVPQFEEITGLTLTMPQIVQLVRRK